MKRKEITTFEEALAAVQKDGWALDYVPEEFKTPELCLTAVKNAKGRLFGGSFLSHVPESLRDEKLCLAAVQQNGISLSHVPKALRTAELCRIAVEENGWALGDVPEELKTKELCHLAAHNMNYCESIHQAIYLVEEVPDEFIDSVREILYSIFDS